MIIHPMRLARIPKPFSHPDWTFELKHDGFRALALILNFEGEPRALLVNLTVPLWK